MTRDAFLEGFTERLRNVLQKHTRELDSRRVEAEASHPAVSAIAAKLRTEAEDLTDAAINELGRFTLDAMASPTPENQK